MKKIAVFLFLALTIASCSTKNENKTQETTKKTQVEQTNKAEKTVVEKGDLITVAYTGSLKDGKVFDASSKHSKPLQFVVGSGKVIPGFDAGVIGMKLGEIKTLNIPAKDAYGETNKVELTDADFKVIEEKGGLKKEDIKVGDNIIPKTGAILKILEIKDGKYYAQNPNPLAGKDLVFEVKILKIEENPKKEMINNIKIEDKNNENNKKNNNK